MRVILASLLLLIAPIAIVIGVKEYQSRNRSKAQVNWHDRGEVLFFNASWCGPCRQMKPIVARLKGQGFKLRDIDVDGNRSLAEKYRISSVPTFVFVKNGSEVRRFSGGTSADHLRELCAAGPYR